MLAGVPAGSRVGEQGSARGAGCGHRCQQRDQDPPNGAQTGSSRAGVWKKPQAAGSADRDLRIAHQRLPSVLTQRGVSPAATSSAVAPQ
jgi:hypothetical protein